MTIPSTLLKMSTSAYSLAVLGFLLSVATLHLARVYWRLRHLPGPLLCKFTNQPRVSWVKTKRAHKIHQEIHDKYGEVVQFGPNMVSVSNPAWIPTLYPIRPGFPKSDFYRTLAPYTNGTSLPAVFNTRDETLHKMIKSPIAPLFSLSNVLPLESFVDDTIQVMVEQLDRRFAETNQTFDLADWLQFFAFDVMGTLTFSKRYGFLEQGRDVDGMLGTIWTFMTTAAPMTQIPWFDQLWYKNRVAAFFRRKTTGFSILRIVGKFVSERQKARESMKAKALLNYEQGMEKRKDMLDRFFEIHSLNPSLPPWCVTAWTFSNIIAGSDSTAVVLRTIWYNLLAHPQTLHRLREELLTAASEKPNGFSKPFPTWKEVSDLPYLDACVNEGIRLHPPFCLPFERVVPKGGVMVGESFLPEGTVVGMSPYVVNRHKATFGEDAESWNPERWLVGGERRKVLEGSVLTFGAGRRVCLGRHISLLEMKKIVPALALRYQFDLLDPKRYTVDNSWFFRQSGIDVKIRK
ncbi:cytochrome P450 [Aspergillus undulatus]|uniref:cytochrome P450 n=1 Tax=Aspergillus undulatus TaxID=1810928 RepID=UPI003CCD2EA2